METNSENKFIIKISDRSYMVGDMLDYAVLDGSGLTFGLFAKIFIVAIVLGVLLWAFCTFFPE